MIVIRCDTQMQKNQRWYTFTFIAVCCTYSSCFYTLRVTENVVFQLKINISALFVLVFAISLPNKIDRKYHFNLINNFLSVYASIKLCIMILSGII